MQRPLQQSGEHAGGTVCARAGRNNQGQLKVVEAARKYLDTPYRHLGRDSTGLDCVGLLCVAFRDACGFTGDFRDYAHQLTSALVFRRIKNYARRIPAEESQPGDVVLMNWGTISTHFGIVCDNGGVIHADRTAGKVIEQRDVTTNPGCRIVAYYRID